MVVWSRLVAGTHDEQSSKNRSNHDEDFEMLEHAANAFCGSNASACCLARGLMPQCLTEAVTNLNAMSLSNSPKQLPAKRNAKLLHKHQRPRPYIGWNKLLCSRIKRTTWVYTRVLEKH